MEATRSGRGIARENPSWGEPGFCCPYLLCQSGLEPGDADADAPQGFFPAKDFGAALGVHPSLVIPFDAKTFGSAANNGQMILDAGAKTKAAEAFQTLAQIVSRRELPAVAGPKAKPGKTPKAAGESKSLFASMFKKR